MSSTSTHTGPHPHDIILADKGWPRGDLRHFPSRQLRDVPPEQLRPWPFPAFLDNPSCRWLQALKRIYSTPLSFPSALSPEAGILLHSLVRNIQPKAVIETGTFIGVSSIWIAAALAELPSPGELHSFDWFGPVEAGPWRAVSIKEGRRQLVESHLREAGVDALVTLHEGWSCPTLTGLRDQGRLPRVQFAFLDADHTERGVWDDFRAVEPLVDTGGYVLLHDTLPELCGCEGPRKLLDTVNEQAVGGYQVIDLYLSPVNYGFGLLRRIA